MRLHSPCHSRREHPLSVEATSNSRLGEVGPRWTVLEQHPQVRIVRVFVDFQLATGDGCDPDAAAAAQKELP